METTAALTATIKVSQSTIFGSFAEFNRYLPEATQVEPRTTIVGVGLRNKLSGRTFEAFLARVTGFPGGRRILCLWRGDSSGETGATLPYADRPGTARLRRTGISQSGRQLCALSGSGGPGALSTGERGATVPFRDVGLGVGRPRTKMRPKPEHGMRRRLGLLLAATGTAATMSLAAQPAFAAGHGGDGGATVEEFVCFRSAGDRIALGTGKIITTPSGNLHVVCTGQPV